MCEQRLQEAHRTYMGRRRQVCWRPELLRRCQGLWRGCRAGSRACGVALRLGRVALRWRRIAGLGTAGRL